MTVWYTQNDILELKDNSIIHIHKLMSYSLTFLGKENTFGLCWSTPSQTNLPSIQNVYTI